MDEQETQPQLDRDELEELEGEPLPPREVMSLIDLGDGGGPIYTLPVEPRDEV